eukprot:2692531-Pyramimonas_sp.AAC.1
MVTLLDGDGYVANCGCFHRRANDCVIVGWPEVATQAPRAKRIERLPREIDAKMHRESEAALLIAAIAMPIADPVGAMATKRDPNCDARPFAYDVYDGAESGPSP